ncbi:MAG: hypothetical protein ACREAK_02395, partial [Nitrosarchaeum sp.]
MNSMTYSLHNNAVYLYVCGLIFVLALFSFQEAHANSKNVESFPESIGIMTSSGTSIDNIITNAPLSESIPIIKIMNISISDVASADKNITLDVTVNGFVVSFVAKNNRNSPVLLDADRWSYSISHPFGVTPKSITNTNFIVPRNGSLEIVKIDLTEYEDIFESFPGVYSIELMGSKFQEKDFGKYKEFAKYGNYHVKAILQIDYDINAIKQQPSYNGLLKSVGMKIGIREENHTGLTNPFELKDNSTKIVSFYLVNNGKERISSIVGSSVLYVWDAKNRFPAVGTDSIREPTGVCLFLNPGESKLLDSIQFSKDGWPIRNIAQEKEKQITSDVNTAITPSPETYIAKYQTGTMSCTLEDGQFIPGANHSLIASFEVIPSDKNMEEKISS